MKITRLTAVSAFVLAVAVAVNAQASTLTFDDVSNVNTGSIHDGYGGLNWELMGFTNGTSAMPTTGYFNGRVSGDYVAFNEGAQVASAGGPTFDFNSAHLTAAFNTGLNITVAGFLGSDAVYSRTVVVNTPAPTLFTFNFLDIDRLTFTSFGGTDATGTDPDDGTGLWFAMDNFTINEVASVPDSGSPLALLSLSLLGIVALLSVTQRT